MLNVRSDELPEYKKHHKKTRAAESSSLKEAMATFERGSYIVIEDIINLAKKEEEALRQLINFQAHHDSLRIICVAHMLFRNKMLTLVPLFNYLVFTLTLTGRALLKQAAVHGFYLEPTRSSTWIKLFTGACKKWGEHGGCVVISCHDVTLYHLDNQRVSTILEADKEVGSVSELESSNTRKGNSEVRGSKRMKFDAGSEVTFEDTKKLCERFNSCFKFHEHSSTANAIFSIIVKVLAGESCFRPFDFTVSFKQTRRPGTVKRISVIDFVDSLLDARPSAPASKEFKVLNNYLAERCKIPRLFVFNPHFRVRSECISSDVDTAESEEEDDNLVVRKSGQVHEINSSDAGQHEAGVGQKAEKLGC